MNEEIQNPNPMIQAPVEFNANFIRERLNNEKDEAYEDAIDKYEIYEIIRTISDPEHPLTLEQLNVVNVENIFVDEAKKTIKVLFTPTIPNCSLSSLIGLTIKIKLLYCVSKAYKIDVMIEPGKHMTEDAINKQLCDKERVYAAFESEGLKSNDITMI